MKTFVFIIFLVFTGYSVNAQRYSSMSLEQLNLALEKAKSKIRVGATLTILGVITTGIGVGLSVTSAEDEDFWDSVGGSLKGELLAVAGIGLMGGGIPTWITGSYKKNKIEIELLRYKNTGFLNEIKSPPIYGVGLKITF